MVNATNNNSPTALSWTASEFIAHHKDVRWYATLAVSSVVVAGFLLLFRELFSATVVVGAAIIFGLYAARKPREIEYRLDRSGITIGIRTYRYEDFRSFAVMPEGAFSSIEFMPLKRFGPPISLYYGPDNEDAIVTLLSDQLPYEERQLDAVDRLMRKIRF